MGRYLRLSLLYMRLSFKSIASYRVAFVMNAISQIVAYTVEFGLTWVMINAFGSMNGWSKYEVILLFAMSLASYALAGFFFFNINVMSRDINNGQFDDVLLKPMGVLPYLICTKFNRGYVAHLFLAIVLIVMCFTNLGLTLTAVQLAFFILSILSGALIFAAFFLIAAATAFFFLENKAFVRIIFFFRQMTYYPLSIFPMILQICLTLVLPYGMINFFPVQTVLGKQDYLFFGSVIQYLAPVVALVLFTAAASFYIYGTKRYESSGS